ncbi:MAG: TolC family protein, partial [Planctomycetales bacterium]|nr:TolC family protein [Planctomycetales bacterium]
MTSLPANLLRRMDRTTGLMGLGKAIWMLSLALTLSGCHRSVYRLEADRDVYCLVDAKSTDPHWPLDGYSIDVDPASRMYDPHNPDCEPMPPDDPTSHQYMHCVYCKPGYPCWHKNGNTPFVENPEWMAALPRGDDGRVLINAESAVQLALLHSPDYQEELETLYLSALDVSFERFRFDTQFFGGSNLFYDTDSSISSSTLGLGSLSGGENGSNLQMRRLFSTGSEMVVGLANSLVWQFAGPDTQTSTSILDFALVQPLLRAGGRERVLETLTIAERALLANVRQMERFRRGYYVEIVTGVNSGPGPNRRGGFFGGSGLEGFSGVGGGGFGRVGGTGGGGGGTFGTGGAGGGQAGGFLGLVQAQQVIQNQRANISALQSSVVQLESFFTADRIDYFQVELARQAYFEAQSRLLNAELDFQRSLDQFKSDLGLPPQVDLGLDDQVVQGFQLVDPAVVPIQNQITDIQQNVGQTILEILQVAEGDVKQTDENAEDVAQLPESPDFARGSLNGSLARLREDVAIAIEVCQQLLEENVPRARRDLVRLRAAVPERKRDIERLNRRYRDRIVQDIKGMTAGEDEDIELLPFKPDELDRLPRQLSKTLDDLVVRYQDHQRTLEKLVTDLESLGGELENLPAAQREQRLQSGALAPIPNALNELAADALSLTLVQARARTHAATLVPVDMDWQSAIEIARSNRRDWMNARAALVDSWRLIEFNADQLQSQLDLVFSGDLTGTGNHPLNVHNTEGRLRMGVRFDAPITRLAERNTYRQALIEYQQARRTYYQFEDSITAVLRNTVRTLDVNQLNFELRRAAVEVAIGQVELARLRLQEPPKPDEVAQLGATTARDLVSALQDLLSAQNDFLSVWINHEVSRRSLDFDLGTMQLDPTGLWLDPGPLVADPVIGEISPFSEADDDDETTRSDDLPAGDLKLDAPAGERPSATGPRRLFERVEVDSAPNGVRTVAYEQPLTPAMGGPAPAGAAHVRRLPALGSAADVKS